VDLDIISAQLALVMPSAALAFLGEYDLLSTGNLPKKEGTLMLSGYHGIREKNGNVIKITGSIEYTEDTGMNKKGDKITEQGSLDLSTNSLTYEKKLERDGKISSRIVIESVILKNGTYLLQYFNTDASMPGGASGEATFKRYDSSGYSALVASFDKGVDFKYDSIIGKGDVQPDSMAAGYSVKGRFTVKGGKVEMAKK